MSPEYKIYVPPKDVNSFEEMISDFPAAEIRKKKETIKEKRQREKETQPKPFKSPREFYSSGDIWDAVYESTPKESRHRWIRHEMSFILTAAIANYRQVQQYEKKKRHYDEEDVLGILGVTLTLYHTAESQRNLEYHFKHSHITPEVVDGATQILFEEK